MDSPVDRPPRVVLYILKHPSLAALIYIRQMYTVF